MHNECMKENLGHDQEDRGVEGHIEEEVINGEKIIHEVPPAVDGLGRPAAPEDDLGCD